MHSNSFERLREIVKAQSILPVDLELKYQVIFSTLQGNLPVPSELVGEISDIPVNLELRNTMIPTCVGSFPVNTLLTGTIGDTPFQARMTYRMFFSTIGGNIAVNTGIVWKSGEKRYSLKIPYELLPATARGGGLKGTGGGGGPSFKKKVRVLFKRGKMLMPDEVGGGSSRIPLDTCRPIIAGVNGKIEEIEIQLRFRQAYYTSLSTGRNPISVRALGFLKYAG